MNYKIDEVEGIGPAYSKKLIEAGVKTTNDLLEKAAKPKDRTDLEAAM
jgi:predicted flap endonuclease-1-like 5' DNA nuclease